MKHRKWKTSPQRSRPSDCRKSSPYTRSCLLVLLVAMCTSADAGNGHRSLQDQMVNLYDTTNEGSSLDIVNLAKGENVVAEQLNKNKNDDKGNDKQEKENKDNKDKEKEKEEKNKANMINLGDINTWPPTPTPTSGQPTAAPVTPAPSTPRPTPRPSTSPTVAPVTRLVTPGPTVSPPSPTTQPTTNITPAPSTKQPTNTPSRNPTTSPSSQPTNFPSVTPTTVMPTLPPSRSPTMTPTGAPTPFPTLNPTLSPTVSPTTSSPTSSPTTIYHSDMNSVNLTKLQVAENPSGETTDLQRVSVALSLWFPNREGINGAEDSLTTSVQTAVVAAMQYLFCVPQGDNKVDFADLGISSEVYPDNKLCAVHENIQLGNGMLDGIVLNNPRYNQGGARRYLQEEEEGNSSLDDESMTSDGTNIVSQQAFESGKWTDQEIEQEVQQYIEWENKQLEEAAEQGESAVSDNSQNEAENQEEDNDNESNQGQDDDNDNDDSKGQKEQNTGKQDKKENDKNKNSGSDHAVLLEPPHVFSRAHFNAHNNLAWTSWTLRWPVVRVSEDYLKKAWLLHPDDSDDALFQFAVELMEQEFQTTLYENIRLKVLDILLEDLLEEPVHASIVGRETATYRSHITEDTDDDFQGNMTALDSYQHWEGLDPEPHHALRMVGITMFLCTLKAIFLLACLSKRRKTAREAEAKRLKEGQGLLHSPEGVEEMLKNTASGASSYRVAARATKQLRNEAHAEGVKAALSIASSQSSRSKTGSKTPSGDRASMSCASLDDRGSSFRIPLPSNLQ